MSTSVKISELPVLASADAADEFVVVDDSAGVTKKITAAALNGSFDASALDDYEEGTFTPFYYGTTTSPSGTYDQQLGYYIKIGSLVLAYFRLRGGATSSVGAGNIQLHGLPYAPRNVGPYVGGASLGYTDGFVTHPDALFVASDGTNGLAINKRSSVTGATANLVAADLGTSSTSNRIIGSVVYETA